MNFPFICSNIPAVPHLHMEYIDFSWSDIPELVVPIMMSLSVAEILLYLALNTNQSINQAKKEATEPRVPSG